MPTSVPTSCEALRLFVFAHHAEPEANTAQVLSSDAFRPVALTARGTARARALGAQLRQPAYRSRRRHTSCAHAADKRHRPKMTDKCHY